MIYGALLTWTSDMVEAEERKIAARKAAAEKQKQNDSN